MKYDDGVIRKLMTDWLTCTTLDGIERSVVEFLLEEASVSVERFEEAKVLVASTMNDVLMMAIHKARLEGIGRHATKS